MVNTNTKETKKRGKIIEIKLIHIIAVIIFIAIIATIFIKLQQNIQKSNTEITPEILRSRSYDAVNNGDEATNSEYVKFDAFFLKDIDLDGNADAIRGTCNEVGKEDTLYMDLKVINNGYFKNGKITINSNNFYLNTTIVKDSIIKANYISNNTKTIDLKEMQNGSQKLLTGIVRSGDYTSQYKKTEAIGNDTTKYSKINSITFTGTHVDDNGVETPINKTINFNVDWYGTTTAGISVSDVKNTVNSFDELLNGENMVLNFTIKTEEKDNDLILKKSYLEGTIPELNGYKPISVEFEGDRITYEYNQETGAFTAQREAIVNENQTVTGIVNTSSYIEKRYNEYKVKVIYPKEAYENMEENSVQLLIPVKTYYEGYNNQNTEFTNPYVSNTAEATIVARWVKYEGFAYRFDITVGKYVASPYSRYVVSKEKPLKIFNNISEQEKDDYYTVRWQLTTGTEGISTGTTMKETKTGSEQAHDNFIKTDSSKETMEELTSNVGIYFSGADGMLGEDGWIKVYNDTTNELIETFTKENWNTYNESNPYRYENAIKHIRVETSATNVNSSFTVYNVKELDDQYITENYTREEFDKLEYINSNLTGTFGTNSSTVTHSAHYEAPLSVASINISKQILSTQETTENQIITIKTETNQYNEQKWKNGTFLVKVPSEIINMEINSVTVDKNRVAILGYDLFEQDGNYYIKVLTENENEETYNINIDCNMTPDPRNTTVTRDIELYAINEQGVDYYYKGNDIYDIDGDLNTEEILNYTKKAINLISPNELLTNQIASNYDDKNSTTIAPRVAKVEKSQRTAEININLTNNYAQDITNVILQGVIPFEGNQFIVGNRELGSQFTTNITNSGIIVPNELVDYTTVYYSTQEKPSNDINDTNNNWKTANEVTDWNSIKTYIISLGDYVLHSKDSHTFKYTINIPEGVNYNEIAYSEHAINFALMTDAGKYNTYTASDKLGFMIAKQYDLEIEKLQENTDKKLQGITFKVTEEGKEESKIRVTDNDGRVKIYGLCAEKTYIIKEIKTTSDYVINEEEIKVYTYTDNEDNLHVAYKNDNGSYTNLEEKYSWLKSAIVHKNDGEDYKVKLQLENEPKARLKIIKNTGAQNLSGVRFKLTGKEKDNNLTTNSNGEINVSGLYLNEEYTLQEVTAKGYYLPNTPIKFTLNTNMNLQITGERITSSSVTKTDEIPTINIQIDNEKIPEYSLKIIKKEKDTETLLQGTQFTLTGEDKSENTIYTTDENGEIQIDNLYQFVEEKNITATYTLKEIYPTEGYVLNNEPLVFKAQKNNSELELQIESGSIRGEAEIDYTNPDNPVITITLDNNPSFTLTKVDEDTNQPLEGVDFQITDMNDNTVTDVNGKDLSKVTTDENGKINLSLGQGLYKAKETKQLPGYEAPELYTGIGIGESKEAEYNVKFDKLNNRFSYCSFNNITEVEGGVIAVGVAGQVVKYDQSGNIEWENTEKSYNFNGVVETNDGLILATENDGIALYKKVITSPEIPDAQNVTVTNKKKRVKITTEVEGTGGSITGQNEAPYEEVKYGEDSVKEIKAVPSDGYSVVKITVNGEEIDFTENDDTTVTLSKFIEMTEDKHVVVTFSDNVSAIEVNHYLWTPSSGVTTTKVADSSTQKGNIDDNYSTVPKFDIEYEIVKNKDIYRNKTEDEIISEINTQYGTTYTSVTDLGYTEITDHEDDNYGKTPFEQFMQDYYIPENATGEFKAETQEINYYYKEITYTLTVKHLIEGTEESVPSITGGTVEDEITDNYSKNSEYETTNSNQVDYSKYQLVEVPENATGTIQGDTEVRYYYRQIEHQITTKVQEHEETNIYGIVEQVKGGTITGEGELPYETVAHGEDSVKDIKAVPEENYEVKSITVNGTPIEFTANADGTVTLAKFIEVTEDKEVIVEFQKKEGRVIIHHYEEGTTTPITLNNGDTATDIVKTGRIGEVYASQPHENAAIKYKVTNATPERSSGRFIDGTIEVTYYYSIRKVEVTVNKVWDDNNNSLEIRPESVRVNLKATIGTESTGIQDVTESVISTDIQKEISLNSGNNWEHTWDNLLQYTEDSQEITYNIEEESFTGNLAIVYSSEVTKDASNPYSLTVTNTYTRPTEKINYVVTKIWDDNSNENGKRPDNLVFDIYKIGENDSRTKVTTYTLNTLSETSHTFELDRYDEKGNEINYVAEEAEKNEGDLHLYTQSGGEKQDITTSGKKTYKSEFTNKFEVPDENVNIEVTKQWDDENNSNQKRPSSIKLVLYRVETLGTGTSATSRNEKVTEYTLDTPSNSNTFEYTFENQPKYDEHGNEITYIVDEEEVNEDDLKLYTKTVQETEENKYNIKNTFTVPDEKIEIEATKVWNEQNDTQKQKRPTSVILKLMNGTETVKSTAVNAQNSWKTTFSDLAKYDETGDEIDYRLAEEEVNTDDLKFYTSAESSSLQRVDDTHYKLTLTNTFGIPNDKIELKVTKAWDDEDGKDRLSSLKLVLTGNGQRYEHILTEANEDSTNSNNWIYTFTNLPKYDSNGEEITYALTEEEVNTGDLEKYITSVDGYTVTNKLKIRDTKIEKTGTTEITSLSDKVNYTINYEAKIDTNYTGTCKVTITDTLPYEIDEAQEYNLNEGTYTAENKTIKWEENVTPTDGKISITKQISFAYKDLPLNIDKFTNKVEGKIECENNITETKEIEWDTIVNFKRNIIVTKEWKGDTTSTQRPEEVEIELRKDGDVEETRQIKLANNWKETFENLNKYDETTRAEIAYTVTENNVPEGYYVEITTEDVSSTGANNLGFKVTNNKYGAIKVTKVDQNDNTKKIGGAEFTLTKLKWENEKWVEDSSYKKVETTSQEETKLGLAEFKNLVYGKYRLQETKAPEGYELIRETMDIDINETNTNYETIVQNKEKTTLPATGAYTKIAAIALGCLLIIVAIRIRNKRHSHY